jgi:hypothetical protein
MNKICLVLDIDETLLHYQPKEYLPDVFEYEYGILENGDRLVYRPGLKEFIDYVNSTNGRIILGIWTYGTNDYANIIVEKIQNKYNNGEKMFHFVYSREDMNPGMLDKELDFIVEKHPELEITKQNTFLVDNRPANIHHRKNINNGIIVESFEGVNKDINKDTMFLKIEKICESLLTNGKIPNKYINSFMIGGNKTPIASIGTNFDNGFTPIVIQKTQKQQKRQRQTRRKQKRRQNIFTRQKMYTRQL